MVDFITNFYMKFSGASWWDYIKPENWKEITIGSLIFLGVFSIITIIWLIVRVFKEDRKNRNTRTQRLQIKPPLFFLYFIFNTFIHILVMCIGMAVGGMWGWAAALIIWCIIHFVNAISQKDNHGELLGIFHIFDWLDQYANKLAEFMLHRKTLKENYKQYLKIEY